MALHIQRSSRSNQPRFQQLNRYSLYLRSSVVTLALGACMGRIEMIPVSVVKMGTLYPIELNFRVFVPNRSFSWVKSILIKIDFRPDEIDFFYHFFCV